MTNVKPHSPLYIRLLPWVALWLLLLLLHLFLRQSPPTERKLFQVQQSIQSYISEEVSALKTCCTDDFVDNWTRPGNRITIDSKGLVRRYLHPDLYLPLNQIPNQAPKEQIGVWGEYLLYLSSETATPEGYTLYLVPIAQKTNGKDWNLFTAPGPVPNVVFQTSTSDYPIVDSQGQAVIYLTDSGPMAASKWLQLGHFGIVLLLLLIAVYLLQRLGLRAIKRLHLYAGIAMILAGLVGMRLLTQFPIANTTFAHWPILNQIFTLPILDQSLGDLLINAFILLWTMIFIHRVFVIQTSDHWPSGVKFTFTLSNYLIILFAFYLVIGMVQYLTTEEQLHFDLQNVFAWGPATICAMLVIILIFLAFFLLGHRAILSIDTLKVPFLHKIGAWIISLGCGALLADWTQLPIPIWQFLAFITVLIGIMDRFIYTQAPNLTWLFGWLIILSSFASTLLYQMSGLSDTWIQEHIVPGLTNTHDEALSNELESFKQLAPHGQSSPPFAASEYLLEFYQWEQMAPPSKPVYSSLSWEDDQQRVWYFRPRQAESEYSILSSKQQNFRGVPHLSRFQWAIYFENQQVYSPSPSKFPRTKPVDSEIFRIWEGTNKYSVVLSRSDPNRLKFIALFSYFFSLFLVVSLLFAAINSRLQLLPPSLAFTISRKPTLSNRIQLWLVGLILVSFLVVGGVSILNFEVSARIEEEKQVAEKLRALELSLRLLDSIPPFEEFSLKSFGQVQQTQIFGYRPSGVLVTGTDRNRINSPWIPNLLPNRVTEQLKQAPHQIAVSNHRFKGQTYQQAIQAIQLPSGKRLFLAIPYGAQRGIRRPSTADFLGTILNAYVFSLLLAAAIAIGVARSITNPLINLGQRLRSLSLEENEPLHWDRKDEIGELIDEYNRMLQKLAESTQQLAQSERESAWREMAKQVAHEIKNPLTPMKLSIQHLEYAIRAN
ncbi:MAG: HAMP domain-containing protein, partial [Bacteroidota bacterium]